MTAWAPQNAPMCISMKTQARFLALVLATGLAACAKPSAEAAPSEPAGETPSAATTKDQGPWEAGDFIASGKPGVPNIEILEVHANGSGEVCGTNKKAKLKYVAMKADGSVLDPGNAPFEFVVGPGNAIAGWHTIVATMRVGDSFTIALPQDLAYGPSQGDLKFDMELLSFQ